VVIISGQRKPFQAASIWNTQMVIKAGLISGVMIRQKMPNSPSPSTRAACASSFGIDT
jgi:hypothetical protein